MHGQNFGRNFILRHPFGNCKMTLFVYWFTLAEKLQQAKKTMELTTFIAWSQQELDPSKQRVSEYMAAK